MLRKSFLIAGFLAIGLGGCQTTLAKIDAGVAQASDKLAARCVELQSAAVVIDLFAPAKVQAAVAQGKAVLDTYCAKPPRTAADVAIFIAQVVRATQAINEARKAPS